MEFKREQNNLARAYLPQKGDIIAVDIMALDFLVQSTEGSIRLHLSDSIVHHL